MKPVLLIATLGATFITASALANPTPAEIADGDMFVCTWNDPTRAPEKGTHGTITLTIVDVASGKARISRTTEGYVGINILDGQLILGKTTIKFVATEGNDVLDYLHAISIGMPAKTATLNGVATDPNTYEIVHSVITTATHGIRSEIDKYLPSGNRDSAYFVYTGTCARS